MIVDHDWAGVSRESVWVQRATSLVPELERGAVVADRDSRFAADGFRLVRESGLTTMLVPHELGGGGASHAEACAVLAELARGCPSTALTLSMHTHLVAAQVWRHRRDLPAPALAKVADGAVLVSTGASDWLESSGTATRVEGGYHITARKSPASGAPVGDVLVTSARTDGAAEGAEVVHVSVPFAQDGVRVEPTWDAMGMRGTGSDTIVLDDVFVPDAAVALVRPAGEWHPIWGVVVGAALPLIMASYLGVAEAAADLALQRVTGRSDADAVVATVGRMLTRLIAARDTVRSMVDASANLSFESSSRQAALALARKTTAVAAVTDVVDLALDVAGGVSFLVPTGLERLFRDVHAARFHPLPALRQERMLGALALEVTPTRP